MNLMFWTYLFSLPHGTQWFELHSRSTMRFPRYRKHESVESRTGCASLSVESSWPDVNQRLSQFIVRDEYHGDYIVFKNAAEFWDSFETVPEEQRCFHEMIDGTVRQKLKFDIDGGTPAHPGGHDVMSTHVVPEFFNELLESLKLSILDTMHAKYGLDVDDDNVLICRSHSPDTLGRGGAPEKLSAHIVINGYSVSNHKQACSFAKDVCTRLTVEQCKLVDIGVYSSLQSFRMPLCHKKDSTRVKMLPPVANQFDALITHTEDCVALPDAYVIEQHSDADAINGGTGEAISYDVKVVLDMAKPYIDGLVFSRQSGNAMFFTRVAPSFCNICQRQHDHDNSLFLKLHRDPSTFTISVTAHCFRSTDKTSVPVGAIVSSAPDVVHPDLGPFKSVGTLRGDGVARFDKIEHYVKAVPPPSVNAPPDVIASARLHGITEIIVDAHPILPPYPLSHTLFVRAPMKIGKTRALATYRDTYFNQPNQVIVMLSFRHTFSQQLKARFPDFILYNRLRGDIDLTASRHLIIQCESLHRLLLTCKPDLLVLDESESIIEQLGSGLSKQFAVMFAKFKWLIKYSAHVILMDANLGDRTFDVVTKIRGPTAGLAPFVPSDPRKMLGENDPPSAARLIVSTARTCAEDKYLLTEDPNVWWDRLANDISSGKHICIVSNSCQEIETKVAELKVLFPAKQIRMYTAHTPLSEKTEDFKDVNAAWKKCDILAYTPTVLAGVSFEEVWFDKIYCAFSDQSCTVESCRQMIGRVRNVGDHEYNVLFWTHRRWFPQTIQSLESALLQQKKNLFAVMEPNSLSLDYSETGALTIVHDEHYAVYLHNLFAKCQSQNNFMERFISQVTSTGAICSKMPAPLAMSDKFIVSPNVAHDACMDRPRHVCNAPDISQLVYEDLQEKIEAGINVPLDMMYAHELYKFKQFYKLPSNFAVTPEYYYEYSKPQTRSIYKNLNDVGSLLAPIPQVLTAVQSYGQHSGACSPHTPSSMTFTKHYIALVIIKGLGFTDETQHVIFGVENAIDIRDLTDRWRKLISAGSTAATQPTLDPFQIQLAFGLKMPVPRTFITFIGNILQPMYDVHICRRHHIDKTVIMYYLEKGKLFQPGELRSPLPP